MVLYEFFINSVSLIPHQVTRHANTTNTNPKNALYIRLAMSEGAKSFQNRHEGIVTTQAAMQMNSTGRSFDTLCNSLTPLPRWSSTLQHSEVHPFFDTYQNRKSINPADIHIITGMLNKRSLTIFGIISLTDCGSVANPIILTFPS